MEVRSPFVLFEGFGNVENEYEGLLLVESAARTCYQSSFSKNKEEQVTFLKKLMKKGHTSILTHLQYTFYTCDKELFYKMWQELTEEGKYRWFDVIIEREGAYLSGNFRVWYETLVLLANKWQRLEGKIYSCFSWLIWELMPSLLEEFKPCIKPNCGNDGFTFVRLMDTPINLVRSIIKIYVDRATMMQWDRHTTLGTSQESQRYVKYNKGICVRDLGNRFNSEKEKKIWLETVEKCEKSYIELLSKNVAPQLARHVLPNCAMVEGVFSGITPFWKHFFNLRLSSKADPAIREVAKEAKKLIEANMKKVFGDGKYI